MAKKRKLEKSVGLPKLEATAKASAKVEATAKAIYQYKKAVTEIVPPDVVRHRARKWFDLLSPLTEWAGKKGDVIRYDRLELQIQREAALDRLASEVQDKLLGKKIKQVLPPKIFIPAVEAASLEDPESDLMKWWADLLVSGVTISQIRPYYIDLMSKIGEAEAAFLEAIWNKYDWWWMPQKHLSAESVAVEFFKHTKNYMDSAWGRPIVLPSGLSWKKKINEDAMVWWERAIGDIEVSTRESLEWADERGLPAEFQFFFDAMIFSPNKRYQSKQLVEYEPKSLEKSVKFWENPFLSKFVKEHRAEFEICRALNIFGDFQHSGEFLLQERQMFRYELRVYGFTEMGRDFMRACRPTPKQFE